MTVKQLSDILGIDDASILTGIDILCKHNILSKNNEDWLINHQSIMNLPNTYKIQESAFILKCLNESREEYDSREKLFM